MSDQNSRTEPLQFLQQLGPLLPVVASILAGLLQALKALRTSDAESTIPSTDQITGPTELEAQFGELLRIFQHTHQQIITLSKLMMLSLLLSTATVILILMRSW